MRALVLALAWAASASSAQDRCLLACDEVTAGAEAAERLAAHLDRPLPEGARVAGLVEGGFQDAFVQARLELPGADLKRLLHDLALDLDDLAPRSGESFGPPAPAGGTWRPGTGSLSAAATSTPTTGPSWAWRGAARGPPSTSGPSRPDPRLAPEPSRS